MIAVDDFFRPFSALILLHGSPAELCLNLSHFVHFCMIFASLCSTHLNELIHSDKF